MGSQNIERDRVNILLVDDQPGKLLSYESILGDLGENLIKAPSATKALEYLLKTDVAVVLIDVCMPDLDGFELAAMIREHPRFEKTALIFVSAIQVTDLDHLRGYQQGAVDYVSVPVVPDILRAKVRVFADLYRKTRELERLNVELERRVAERTAELESSMARLRQSDERLKLAIDGAKIATWDADPEAGDAIWSHSLFAMLGLAPTPGGGATMDMWLGRVHPDDRKRSIEAIEVSRRARSPYADEHRIVREGTGEVAWISSFGRFLYDDSGTPVRFVGVCTDVTERRSHEEERRLAARRKDEFLATLSHELRNPLAPILTATQLLRADALPTERRANARRVIERQVGQLVRLVDDLLDVSRITNDKVVLRCEPVCMAGVVERAIEMCTPLFEARSIRLALDTGAEDITVDGDLVRLVQVLGNLLNNAAKYTSPGGLVTVAVQRDGTDVVVRVRDTGMGISRDMLPAVFDLFTQASRMPTIQGGLGIGLALVRRFVEMHGGSVSATSELGRGSEFVVRLPALPAVEPKPPPDAPVASIASETGCRVLIADDNHDAAESLAELCEYLGHTVRIAYDGLEAVEAASAFLPRIVLLDIGMPGLDGYETARRIRQERWGKDVLLIALTGWAQSEDRHLPASAGFDRHLTKPVSVEHLETILAGEVGRAERVSSPPAG